MTGDVIPFAVQSDSLVPVRLEQGLLGMLLSDCRRVLDVPTSFRPEHFATVGYAEVFHVTQIAAAQQTAGNCVDLVVNSLPDGMGLRAHVAHLLATAPSLQRDMVVSYANGVTDFHRRRETVAAARRLIGCMQDVTQADLSLPMTAAIADIDALANGGCGGGHKTLAEAAARVITHGELVRSGQASVGLSTGFASLDKVLGGLEPGTLTILGARPGMGKTALAMQMAIKAAKVGVGTLVVSLEMQAEQLARRALAIDADLFLGVLKTGAWNADDAARIVLAHKSYADLPLSIEDEGGLNMAAIGVRARAAKRRHGLDLLVLDHLHIVAGDPALARSGQTAMVEKISNDLKRLAKEMDIPVLALAQLNREVESRDEKRPGKSDLRQSGSIEQDADNIMFLYRPEYYLPKTKPEANERETEQVYEKRLKHWHDARESLAGVAEVIFGKVRDGEEKVVNLRFNASRVSFEEVSG